MSRWNFKKELARKFVHFLSILVLLIYFLIAETFTPRYALFILALILMIFLEFEYLRIEKGNKIPFLNKLWKYLRRKKEKDKLGGDVFFLLGAILVLAIFDTQIAMAAILMTTFGDLAAALIGSKFGKHFFMKERAWEGTIAEFVVNILIGIGVFFIYAGNPISSLTIWIIIIVMSLTATIVETLIYKMDDNLVIPLFAGFNGQIAKLILDYLRIT
jgi:phytol kinase